MNTFKVTFEDGNTLISGMNASLQEATEYYTTHLFNFGDTEEHPKDKLVRGVKVELIPETSRAETFTKG
jgi:hypothetical protein